MEPDHGKAYTYNKYNCRCVQCTEAHRLACKRARDKKNPVKEEEFQRILAEQNKIIENERIKLLEAKPVNVYIAFCGSRNTEISGRDSNEAIEAAVNEFHFERSKLTVVLKSTFTRFLNELVRNSDSEINMEHMKAFISSHFMRSISTWTIGDRAQKAKEKKRQNLKWTASDPRRQQMAEKMKEMPRDPTTGKLLKKTEQNSSLE